MDARKKNFSVLMLPWLAHGHISPYLELSKKLASRNVRIYFCSTPVNLNSIKLSPKHSNSIQLVELRLPSSFPDLPPHYHTTNGLPPHLMTTLKHAFDMAASAFSNLLQNLKPDLVIYDFVQPWASAVASALNIPAVHFLVFSAVTTSFLVHFSRNHADCPFPFSSIFVHDYMKPKVTHLLESSSNGIQDKERYFQSFELSRNVILAKTFRELEGKYIDLLSVLVNKKIVPVGPIVADIIEDQEDDEMEIMKWLDKKERSSTVFVSFGSEYFLSKEEREETAHGLELSQVNFIWVLRFPNGEKMEVKEALPLGFLERTKERGKIIENWAPQAKILGHTSIGGFVSHCGWSSVIESMKLGVPIVATPMHLDQPLNARLVEDVGVGLEVIRRENGSIERDEFSRVIREVVVDKNGEKIRRKAREMSELMKKKGEEEIDEVVNELVQLSVKRE
uniref:Glycosyltransferase n=1 Tax=Litchi chinensis TaxID=151069 RepID=W8FZB4_LITCN|nr:flavanone-O-glucoside 2''-O-beta-L-rhamnosyltransferase-like protein 4 [Litchi chinensis]